MTYQNRIELTVETFKGLNNRASNVATNALKIFETQSKLFQNLSEMSKDISLVTKISPNLQYVPGIPGSQYDALVKASEMLANFFSESDSIENNTNQIIISLKDEYLSSLSKINHCLTDMCSNSHQIDTIKSTVKDNQQKLPSKLSKYQKSINNIISSKTKVKKSSEAVSLMEKIISIRNENPMYQKSIFNRAADKCMDGISENSAKAIQLIKKQFCTQRDVLQAVINSNKKIIDNCSAESNQAISFINIIKYQNEFQKYVDKYKIIRYDLLPDPFVPLNFNHKCFSNISTISNVLSLKLYPYAMARIKKDFNAKDNNELPMQKGKMVLLMEDLSLPWTFIQNPYTKVMGYAPSSFLELIGNGLGVILNEVTTTDEILNKGDYIAIENDDSYGSKKVCTISGLTATIPSSNIGIISEF